MRVRTRKKGETKEKMGKEEEEEEEEEGRRKSRR
jgi:hypothetical protein